MRLQKKAFYRLLRLKKGADPKFKAPDWAVENLRLVPEEELFSRLNEGGLLLDRKRFLYFAQEAGSPEELSEILFFDEWPDEKKDPFHLLIFELWRRLCPDRSSISIVCDELDETISLYDEGELGIDDLIRQRLADFLRLLEENLEPQMKKETVFEALSTYCAHDLEGFIFDYTADLLDRGNEIGSAELIEHFFPYAAEPASFDFLRARLLGLKEREKGLLCIEGLLERAIPFHLLIEIAQFLSVNSEEHLFKRAVRKALPLATEEEELKEMKALVADFYQKIGADQRDKKVERILQQKTSKSPYLSDLTALNELMADISE